MKTNISEIKERNKDKLFQVSNFSKEPILFNKQDRRYSDPKACIG